MNGRIKGDEVVFSGDLAYPIETPLQIEASLKPLLALTRGKPMISNLESALWRSESVMPPTNGIFSTYSGLSQLLRQLDVRGVSIANNHTFDGGEMEFLPLLDLLDKKLGISYFGTKETKTGIFTLSSGASIRVLGGAWRGTGAKGQLINLFWSPDNLYREIEYQRLRSDYLIAFVHWGYEFEPFPLPAQKVWAHSLIDAGADAVIGTHPHVIQGFEIYNERLIAYSLGNFIFPKSPLTLYHPNSTSEGALLRIHFGTDRGYRFQFEGFKGSDLSTEVSAIDLREKLLILSAPLKKCTEDYREWYLLNRKKWYLPAFSGDRHDIVRIVCWLALNKGVRVATSLRLRNIVKRILFRRKNTHGNA